MVTTRLFIGLLALLTLSACNLEQEIEIELPEYESQLVVESYLLPDQPFSALLTRSSSYFAPFATNNEDFLDNTLVSGANVTITHKGTTYQLSNRLVFNPIQGKIFNYVADENVPMDYGNDFELRIETAEGQLVTATTRLLPVVPIDSLVVEFNETDTLARVLTYFTDDLEQENFYRRIFSVGMDSLEQDFVVDDRFVDSTKVVFGTAYDYAVGDTVQALLYHIDEDYFNFQNSILNATAANGNPFVQPSSIISNVRGDGNPIGIFTGISADLKRRIIQQ